MVTTNKYVVVVAFTGKLIKAESGCLVWDMSTVPSVLHAFSHLNLASTQKGMFSFTSTLLAKDHQHLSGKPALTQGSLTRHLSTTPHCCENTNACKSASVTSPLALARIRHLTIQFSFKEIVWCALAGVTQWVEHRPANWKVASLIPGQGTCLGCRPGPQLGVWERQLMDVSLTHQCSSPSHPLSLKNKIFFLKRNSILLSKLGILVFPIFVIC